MSVSQVIAGVFFFPFSILALWVIGATWFLACRFVFELARDAGRVLCYARDDIEAVPTDTPKGGA